MKFSLMLITPFLFAGASATCPEVKVQEGFDLEEYISAPWYAQEQAVVEFQPLEQFYCVRAQYSLVGGLFRQTVWGYKVNVNNHAQDATGKSYGGDLCAYQTNEDDEPAKLAVAPCFLPRFVAGPYWVVAYEEGENGFALVSGGQPSIETESGLCRTGDGTNNAGLWIFTRAQERNHSVVDTVRQIAVDQGFDVSVLFNVTQDGCVYGGQHLGQRLRG